jgi:antitoxin VapB
MNIKNEEAHRLAQELAALSGQSITSVVTEALRERLLLLRNKQKEKLSQRLLSIGAKCASRLKGKYKSIDHADFLYDDKGLPK